jgi:hypothetical protein
MGFGEGLGDIGQQVVPVQCVHLDLDQVNPLGMVTPFDLHHPLRLG